MVKIIIITIVAFITTFSITKAQNIQFMVSAPSVVTVGERFRIEFTTNQQGQNLKLPPLGKLNILMGPSTSSSTSIQIINSKKTRESTYSYSYIAVAKEKGKIIIKPAQITVGGKQYHSNSIAIDIIAKGGNNTTNRKNSTNNTSSNSSANNQLFLKLEANKTKVYLGEDLTVTLKLYTTLDISQIGNFRTANFNGFLSQEIENATQVQFKRVNVNGKIYNVAILKKDLLFPQKFGKITIPSFSLDCISRKQVQSNRRDIFDNFFGNYKETQHTLKSKPLTINVKALPQQGKPNNFNGAVGNFTISSTIDKPKLTTNEALTYKIKIGGNGNFKLLENLKIDFPPSFEVYDPKINTTANRTNGSKTFEYIIIPRDAGEFTIQPIYFSYFNTRTKKYTTLKTKKHTITVEKGKGNNTPLTAISSQRKEDLKFLGKDIRYIKTNNINLIPKNNLYLTKTGFYLIYIFAFLLFVIIFILFKKRIKEYENIALLKNKKANKVARKKLKRADTFLKQQNKEAFYSEILKAMWGYLSDKLAIPISHLNKDNSIETLKKYKVPEETINDFIQVINTCEFAQFSPSSEESELNKQYKDTVTIISKLENQIKKSNRK